ncbi:unnamed protein product [Parnassius apollo]|uniref:(apollo) hypothetical protein n=1 Tax=Parnassius apollo TaxID=110799 RepID=A0A8S3XFS7_PARAO|nr:unnamed protein product [Parnassius apollo]
MANRVSNDQLEELLEFLGKHPALAKGVGLGARSKETFDKQWNDLATKLNAHGSGSSKSGERLAKRRQDSSATGGGPSSQDDLSETDKKILSVIGKQAVFGDSEHRVPIFTTESDTGTVKLPETVKSTFNKMANMQDLHFRNCCFYTSKYQYTDTVYG